MANYNGVADFGAALRGPDGRICVSTPGLIGKPQYGKVTTCYGTQIEQKRVDRPTTLYGEPTDSPPTGRKLYWLVVALTIGLAIALVTGVGEVLVALAREWL
jgi:hypothetical protein